MNTFLSDAQTWAMTQFATTDLHDERRTKRLVLLATQIAADPSGSFPQQTESWNDLRAAYNFFDCEDVTFQAIASHHWERGFIRELAKLGGFLGRRRDGEPGWMTIWRGWDKLQTMIRGADAIIGISTPD